MKRNHFTMVLTNHGLAKFPIQQTSELLAEKGMLFKTVGGILVPTNSCLRRNNISLHLNRLLNRSQGLPSNSLIVNSYLGETLWQMHLWLRRRGRFLVMQRMTQYLSFVCVDSLAKRILKRSKMGEIQMYHCRSGFGRKSLLTAKKMGIPSLCEHTTAHPDFRLLRIEQTQESSFSIDKLMRQDLKSADHLLVPSEWVKETILQMQSAPQISVLTPPIDSNFKYYLKSEGKIDRDIDILFVGYVSILKGFQRFYSIIQKLEPGLKITIAGLWDPQLHSVRKTLQQKNGIEILDFVEHAKIANLMLRSKILLFPSQNEGAARVVDEAIHAEVLVMATKASFANFKQSAIYIDDIPDDKVSELIQKFLNSPSERYEITKTAKKDLEKRDSLYFENLLNIYNEIGINRGVSK